MKENVFNEMAKKYDSEERIELANIIADQVKEDLQNSKDKTLLDYGSGTGLVSLQLSDLVKSVLLADSSKQMLEVAETKISKLGITNADVLQADFTEESPDRQVDIILVSLVLLHIPETQNILQELSKALNAGGKLILVDFDKNENISHPKVHNGFLHEELKNKLVITGFSSTDIQTFHHGENIFMKKDASMFIATSTKE